MSDTNTNQRLTVACRPARPEDTPDMLELTRNIWDGHDYVPHTWERWLADPEGRLAVAEHQGRVLGLSKLTHLDGPDWWLEGLRVHPEYQGRGIAAQLHDYLLDCWQQIGDGVLRMATSSKRLPVHHLCERSGFQRIAVLTSYVAPPGDPKTASEFQPLAESECEAAAAFARRSPTVKWQGGLMDNDWEWAPPAAAYLQPPAVEGRAWWWRERRGLLVQRLDSDDENPELGEYPMLQLAACSRNDLPDLLGAWRGLAAAQDRKQVSCLLGQHPALLAILAQAGFERDWDAELYIYALEKPGA